MLIEKSLASDEINEVRKSNLSDFDQNPQLIKNDLAQTESTLEEIYSANSPDSVAYFHEQLFSNLYQAAQRNPQFNDESLMEIYNRHIQISQYDPAIGLSLSNQDVEAYISYFQFQNMFMGHFNTATSEELEVLQVQIVNNFNGLPIKQKRSLAFASFIWETVERQWSNLNSEQQKQYIEQVRNLSNAPVDSLPVQYSTEKEIAEDIQALVEKSKTEAEAKGMSVEQYIRHKQRELNANSNLLIMMQNNMTENHATMMNVINNLGEGDDYYYVEYNN